MKKRPLCFLCILLVAVMWILRAFGISKELLNAPNVPLPLLQSEVSRLQGKIYKYEYKEDKLILFLKQTILSVDSKHNLKLKNVRITCKGGETAYQAGDRIYAEGLLRPVTAPSNPGEFDARTYYGVQNVAYTMWEPQIWLAERPVSAVGSLAAMRDHFAELIKTLVPEETCGVLWAMMLGKKDGLDQKIRELFQIGGISHALAISGLHLGVLGMGLYRLFRRCGMSFRAAGLLSSVFLCCYGIMTGASVATLRALLMFLLAVGADMLGRTYDGPTGLALTAVLLLSGNPDYLYYSGFLLSFSAVFSFLMFHGKKAIVSSVCLNFFMAPVVLYFYYELPLFSTFLNLLVVPSLGLVLTSGIAGCILGSFSRILGSIALIPAVLLIQIYKYLCELIGRIPGAVQILGQPSPLQIVLYYGIMAAGLWLYRRRRLLKRRFLVFLLMIPGCFILTFHGAGDLQITMLDVGQGDSIVVSTPAGNHYLMDGGSSTKEQAGSSRILPYLKYRGIRSLECIFLTHPDEDHMNGIAEILEMVRDRRTALKIGRLVLPDWKDRTPFKHLSRLAEKAGIEVAYLEKGGTIQDGEVRFSCLHPGREDYRNRTNEGSMVLLANYGNFAALFTGDLEGPGEKQIEDALTDIDVLKVAHHGSKNSTGIEFLEKTKPEVSLISCGKYNRYGHPHAELLDRLRNCGSSVYETRKLGAITICTDGEKIDLKTYCDYNK